MLVSRGDCMENTMDIGTRIRYFRQLRGWSQERLAFQAGINPAFLGHLERGLKSPTVTTLEKIVFALKITMEDLFAEKIVQEDERQRATNRILYSIRELDAAEIDRLADIVQSVLDFRTSPAAALAPPDEANPPKS